MSRNYGYGHNFGYKKQFTVFNSEESRKGQSPINKFDRSFKNAHQTTNPTFEDEEDNRVVHFHNTPTKADGINTSRCTEDLLNPITQRIY
jgi:uncharacterized protein YwqG